jgi:hypothetical protein
MAGCTAQDEVIVGNEIRLDELRNVNQMRRQFKVKTANQNSECMSAILFQAGKFP